MQEKEEVQGFAQVCFLEYYKRELTTLWIVNDEIEKLNFFYTFEGTMVRW